MTLGDLMKTRDLMKSPVEIEIHQEGGRWWFRVGGHPVETRKGGIRMYRYLPTLILDLEKLTGTIPVMRFHA